MQYEKNIPLAVKIDLFVSYFLRKIVYWIFMLVLFVSGLACISLLSICVFEYGDGIYDISMHEWIFLGLISVFIWRGWAYSSRFNISIRYRLIRVFLFLGRFFVFFNIVWMGGIIFLMLVGKEFHSILSDPGVSVFFEIFLWCGVCFTLYLASPGLCTSDDRGLGKDQIPVVHSENLSSEDKVKE